MAHDGEVFYYRSDRPIRSASAVAVRPPIREAYYEPEPPAMPTAPPAYDGGDRVARLEQMVRQLEATVTQLTQVIQGMAVQPPPARAPQAVQAPQARAAEPTVQYLQGDEAAREIAELTGGGGDRVVSEENVKVSMYAGGGATAIVGQIRVTQ